MLGQIQVRKEIAERLQQARVTAGYTSAEDFCEKNNLCLKDYQRHEEGNLVLRASQAMRYCELLSISLHKLMLGDDWEKSTEK